MRHEVFDKLMCQRLYIGSRSALPTARAVDGSPYLAVVPLSKEGAAVRRWFSRDATFFAEAYASPCGCGFPELTEFNAGRAVPRDERAAAGALVNYLAKLSGRKYVVELLLCWTGEESEKPTQKREVVLSDISSIGFRFRRGEILRVRAEDLGKGA